jgi:glycosyltransferase involved in cell wall biosynthesis
LLDHPLVEPIGEIGDNAKSGFLGNARALLFPINWPEPFGMVMIEAMAAGTPVIAYRCGSVMEVVEHGLTGFIVDSQDEAVAAVGMLGELDRRKIRARFIERFSAERMAHDYVELYRKAAQGRSPTEPALSERVGRRNRTAGKAT